MRFSQTTAKAVRETKQEYGTTSLQSKNRVGLSHSMPIAGIIARPSDHGALFIRVV
jgi:hypothetical protein